MPFSLPNAPAISSALCVSLICMTLCLFPHFGMLSAYDDLSIEYGRPFVYLVEMVPAGRSAVRIDCVLLNLATVIVVVASAYFSQHLIGRPKIDEPAEGHAVSSTAIRAAISSGIVLAVFAPRQIYGNRLPLVGLGNAGYAWGWPFEFGWLVVPQAIDPGSMPIWRLWTAGPWTQQFYGIGLAADLFIAACAFRPIFAVVSMADGCWRRGAYRRGIAVVSVGATVAFSSTFHHLVHERILLDRDAERMSDRGFHLVVSEATPTWISEGFGFRPLWVFDSVAFVGLFDLSQPLTDRDRVVLSVSPRVGIRSDRLRDLGPDDIRAFRSVRQVALDNVEFDRRLVDVLLQMPELRQIQVRRNVKISDFSGIFRHPRLCRICFRERRQADVFTTASAENGGRIAILVPESFQSR